MEIGQHHHFALTYLSNYANEVAYLGEDTRRKPNGTIFRDILTECTHTRPQWPWCGYWQQRDVHRAELLAA